MLIGKSFPVTGAAWIAQPGLMALPTIFDELWWIVDASQEGHVLRSFGMKDDAGRREVALSLGADPDGGRWVVSAAYVFDPIDQLNDVFDRDDWALEDGAPEWFDVGPVFELGVVLGMVVMT